MRRVAAQYPLLVGGDGPLGAYRTVTKESARKRWYTNVPEAKQKDLIPASWFEAWADATWATDPASAQSGLLRAPNGVVQDVREYWAAGKPAYDPGRIDVPVLLAHAEWDADTPSYMAQTLFGLLVNAPWKRMVEIGEGTHTVVMERNRLQLFREVNYSENSRQPPRPWKLGSSDQSLATRLRQVWMNARRRDEAKVGTWARAQQCRRRT
jgi:pimeloyl-ACP methyl ester carboxylesterase